MIATRWLFPLLLLCAEVLTYLSNDMYVPALPEIMRDFQVQMSDVQLTAASWFLGSTLLQLFVGPLSDRVGRRPVLIAGMILFVLSTFACAIAPNILTLILARFVEGSTVCFIVVAGYACVHELFEQATAIRVLTVMNSIVVLAPAIGPFLGGVILIWLSWRWTFWALLIIGVITLLALIKWMPEPLPMQTKRSLKLSYLLRQYGRLLANKQFILLLLANCFAFSGMIAWLVSGPFFIVDQFHYPAFVFGLFQVVIFGCFILGNYCVKRWLVDGRAVFLIKKGLLLTSLGGLLAVCFAILFPQWLSGLILGMSLFSFGFGLTAAPLGRLIIEASNEPMGARVAVVSMGTQVAALAATIMINYCYNGQLLSLAGILLGVALIATLCLPR